MRHSEREPEFDLTFRVALLIALAAVFLLGCFLLGVAIWN